MSGRVAAVIVTYNRKDVLRECLAGIHAQTRRPDLVVIMDNGSADGTFEDVKASGYLTPSTEYLRFDANKGPARAFWQGMSYAYAAGADWLWVMDDDVVPDPDGLELLLGAAERHFPDTDTLGFLCSRVRAPDGRPMNTPEIAWRTSGDEYASWDQMLDHGMVQVRRTALISNLFPRSTLRDFPPTPPDYFMWGEDSDFTMRITEQRPAFMVAAAKAVHLRAISKPLNPLTETDPARLRRMATMYRNTLFLRRRFYPPAETLMTLVDNGRLMLKALLKGKPMAAWAVLRGTLSGLWFHPSYPVTADAALMAEARVLSGRCMPAAAPRPLAFADEGRVVRPAAQVARG